ncbi:hypothetical protein ACFWDZ_33385, partial [Micromonospora aurantiaca]
TEWTQTLIGSPASPWTVAVADTATSCADTDGAILAAAMTSTQTTALVHTTSGLPWTSAPADLPFDVRVSGEVLRVTAVAASAADTFTRTVASGWGTATTGQTWTLTTGTTSERSVDGTRGVVTVPNATISIIRFQTLAGLTLGDCEVRARISAAQVSTGAAMIPSILLRYVDTGNFYRCRLHFSPGGVMSVSIARDVTQLGDAFLPYTYTAGDSFEMRVRLDGQRIRMKVWPSASIESSAWSYETTVTTNPITSGLVGVTASGFAGNTNVNPAIAFDNFEVITPQALTVTRSMNRVVKALAAGADVRLATPAIVAL